jgi:hypothetical protein
MDLHGAFGALNGVTLAGNVWVVPQRRQKKPESAMRDTNIEVSAPALVLVMPNSIGAATHSKPDDSEYEDFSEYEEEHEGNVFAGLKSAMIIYLLLAVGIATAWKLYHLLG